jgi:16S rRNA (guanine966-N2)-methyltransferase
MTTKVQLRIVAGDMRGRKLTCAVNANLRPTPQRVREALFSILGNAVPDQVFFDVFAGSGIIGLEALSRGASSVLFVERDLRLAKEIDRHLREFGCADQAKVLRTDVFRWAEYWQPPGEPVNVFVSPPFKDIQEHTEEMLALLKCLEEKIAPGSILILQSEKFSPLDDHAAVADWEKRKYGRNVLMLWGKPVASSQ